MKTDLRPPIIPDSSVMIKWCVKEEEDRKQIVKMQEDFMSDRLEILVPQLLEWEVNNYLGRSFDPDLASEKYSNFKMLHLREASLTLEISHSAFEIMKKCPGVTFYDASYHALALNKGGTFLTADKKYYEKTKNHGNIMLLKDYS